MVRVATSYIAVTSSPVLNSLFFCRTCVGIFENILIEFNEFFRISKILIEI